MAISPENAGSENMNGFGVDIDVAMTVVRAIHFAATAIAAGTLTFRAVVAEPAFRAVSKASAMIDAQIRLLVWIDLAAAVLSGAIWLALQAAAMSGQSFGEALMSGAMITVLNETQFGLVSEIRLGFAILLAVCLTYDRSAVSRWLSLGLALGLVATIAWTGHAASTPHKLGYLHLTADALHLAAAAAWIGGMVPLALLLNADRRSQVSARALLEHDAVRRFSSLGIVSVATLIVSGVINTWILVGSFRGLIEPGYGWILLFKIAVFAIMLAFAAVNRFWLTPRLAAAPASMVHRDALRGLTRNSLIEIALGLVIFAVVGVLGALHPAAHLVK
jgi:copper resistance protein D